MKTKRKFNPEFKAKVVLESLKERSSIEELASKFDLHPSQISIWRKQFLENSSLVFDNNPKSDKDEKEVLIKELYSQIGELKVANDWLKKSFNNSLVISPGGKPLRCLPINCVSICFDG